MTLDRRRDLVSVLELVILVLVRRLARHAYQTLTRLAEQNQTLVGVNVTVVILVSIRGTLLLLGLRFDLGYLVVLGDFHALVGLDAIVAEILLAVVAE